MNRRQFLKRTLQMGGLTLLGGVGLTQYGRHIEPEWVSLEQVTIPIPNLPTALQGFKIIQLSDLHIYPHTTVEFLAEVVPLVNQRQPDLIVLTGDLITDKAEAIRDVAPVLARLNARHGLFAIQGNHELWSNPRLVQQVLAKEGIPTLINQGLPVTVGREQLYLAGVDDCWSGQPDLQTALENAPPTAPVILLAHEPDVADQFSQDGRVALQLSGHTHGGQVRLPRHGAIFLPRYGKKYQAGLYQVDGMWLYTNRGLGVNPLPYRVNCPPEITEFTLV